MAEKRYGQRTCAAEARYYEGDAVKYLLRVLICCSLFALVVGAIAAANA
jgi:hypothetical protein